MTTMPDDALCRKADRCEPKQQCVEFARNWLQRNLDLTYAKVDIAANIWDRVNHYISLLDGRQYSVTSIINGAALPPGAGDLIVYSEKFLGTGHVAVVVTVNTKASQISVCEQNFANEYQPPDQTRSIPLIHHNDRYWLLDAYLLGWKQLRESI